jgi:exodeoxyribonuclease-1
MQYVFYDTETTGVNTAFDQILQFAAICTDENFNELERLEVRSRLLPHMVASAGACKVNGVSVAQLDDPSFPSHYGMVRTIQEKLRSWSPAMFIGYNSIRFDENIFRQALYQTLHSPYLTNSGGNCRSDAMRMVHAVSVFAPDALTFPINEKGRISFKLDRLAPANGFKDHNAHDALGDVEATIYICRLIRERAPAVWSSFQRFSRKAAAEVYMLREPIWCLTESYGGRPYTWLVTALGRNPNNPTEICVADLSNDPEEFSALNELDLAVRITESPKPIRWVKANACPIIMPREAAPESVKLGGIDSNSLFMERAQTFRNDRRLVDKLLHALTSTQTIYPPAQFIEQQIYEGFFTPDDEELMAEFHHVSWEKRWEISKRFSDHRLRSIALRLIYAEQPEALPSDIRETQRREVSDRLLGIRDDGPWLTLPRAIAETEAMIAEADPLSSPFLTAYRAYLGERVRQLTQ